MIIRTTTMLNNKNVFISHKCPIIIVINYIIIVHISAQVLKRHAVVATGPVGDAATIEMNNNTNHRVLIVFKFESCEYNKMKNSK